MAAPDRDASRALPWILPLALVLASACSKGGSSGPALEATLARERAAAFASKSDHGRARDVLAPLVADSDAAVEDLVRAAAVEFALGESAAAEAFLERIARRDASSPAAHYIRGQMLRESGDSEAALGELRAAFDADPSDDPTRYALASVYHDLDQRAEAEEHYRAIVARGIENAGAWYVAALYRLERLMLETERDAEADELYTRRQALLASGIQPASESVLRQGTYARLAPPAPQGSRTVPAAEPIAFTRQELALGVLEGARALAAHDVDGDGRMDVVATTPRGVGVALRAQDAWREEAVASGDVALALAFDADGDTESRWIEIAVARGARVELFVHRDGGWQALPGAVPELPSAPLDAIAVDFDHEGDLDLLLVGAFGARLWRNDGVGKAEGGFTDASAEAGLPADVELAWCNTEDFDGDSDVDLCFGGSDGALLADSLRGGRFELRRDAFGANSEIGTEPIVADFDADGRPDLWLFGEHGNVVLRRSERGYDPIETGASASWSAVVLDLDLDGAADLAWDGGALLAAGLPQQASASFTGWEFPEQGASVCFADFDGDLDVDAIRVRGGMRHFMRNEGVPGKARLVRLRGTKDNARAVGAIVEVRARNIYRRIYYRGEQELVGAGPHEKIDVLRIRWPNGVVQTELDQELGAGAAVDDPEGRFGDLIQSEGLVGSCPFLYAWNGTQYGFVSDVLGITPLGLPMAPGLFVPPDHDEYVLVRGDQLVPKDGRYELQLTEELREVTYLDRARLEVVDHPEGTEVFPNERFTFPPFPEARTHVLRDPLVPLRAVGSDGAEWTSELARLDSDHARPFKKLAPRFQGLAEPWFLELEFDATALQGASELRLVLSGWFRWTDASVNLAAARTPGVEFVPPILQVPDGVDDDGRTRWRDAGPPIGFPAGKPKTMVVDVGDLGLERDPRLRIRTTLQLYWDRIALAVGGEEAELRVTSLEPLSAKLWERGFGMPLPVEREDVPERFAWDELAAHPRWDQHPGLYTRHGECLELVTAIDDRFAILGAGDALTLAFDASLVPPPPPGFVRDYLLFLDGWAKDRDANTAWALGVEPLPFHGMSGYPYRDDERFPDDEAHERWRREWNTSDARTWVEPLVPLCSDELAER